MKILKNIKDLKKAISKISNLGFVPTMGGLHKGHISLIKLSKKKCNKTLVSIYVNPIQFNRISDFRNYPRNLNNDIKILKKHKVDFLFIPHTKEILKNKNKKIVIKNKDKILCAIHRKGHFEGVLEIMNRFVKIIFPKYIFLGEKDYQQYFLIKKYFKKRFKNTRIYLSKTIRDKNLIALSTRNMLLNKKKLRIASNIVKILIKFKKDISKNNNKILDIKSLKKELSKKFDIKIDYLEIRNKYNLSLNIKKNSYKVFIAYYLGQIRMIDNF